MYQINQYNKTIGTGINSSVIEIAEILKKYYGSISKVKFTGDFCIGDFAHNMTDISKAKAILEFEPHISLDDGLAEFCKWVIDQETDK